MFQDSVPAGSYNDPFLSSVCVCVFWLHALSAIQGLCRPALHGAVVPLWNLPGHPAVCTAAAQISGKINGLTGFAFGILHCFRLHGKNLKMLAGFTAMGACGHFGIGSMARMAASISAVCASVCGSL